MVNGKVDGGKRMEEGRWSGEGGGWSGVRWDDGEEMERENEGGWKERWGRWKREKGKK
jgi:hypothetical protein